MRVALGTLGFNRFPYRFASDLPAPEQFTRALFGWASAAGFDAVELEDCWAGFYSFTERELLAYRELLASLELPVGCFKVRHKSLCEPTVREPNQRKLRQAVTIAGVLGIPNLSVSLAASPQTYRLPESELIGRRDVRGSSRSARPEDFELTADGLRKAAQVAAAHGVTIAIEVHQFSLADTSASTLRLVEMVGMPNVGVNPDLGNILWAYDEPPEPWWEALANLAPSTVWWHCKNLRRIHVPELERAFFIPAPLDDGDIDYRYAIQLMRGAGYDGHLVLEGSWHGDNESMAKRGLAYVQSILADGVPERQAEQAVRGHLQSPQRD